MIFFQFITKYCILDLSGKKAVRVWFFVFFFSPRAGRFTCFIVYQKMCSCNYKEVDKAVYDFFAKKSANTH